MAVGIVAFLIGYAFITTPGYVIARRRGLANPWIAFVPFFGLAIVLFESAGRSGWFALVGLVPSLGAIIISVWTGLEVPARHGRSGWWSVGLVVPFLNLLVYWPYALTLEREDDVWSFA